MLNVKLIRKSRVKLDNHKRALKVEECGPAVKVVIRQQMSNNTRCCMLGQCSCRKCCCLISCLREGKQAEWLNSGCAKNYLEHFWLLSYVCVSVCLRVCVLTGLMNLMFLCVLNRRNTMYPVLLPLFSRWTWCFIWGWFHICSKGERMATISRRMDQPLKILAESATDHGKYINWLYLVFTGTVFRLFII